MVVLVLAFVVVAMGDNDKPGFSVFLICSIL